MVVDPSGKLEDTFRRSTALPDPEGVLPLRKRPPVGEVARANVDLVLLEVLSCQQNFTCHQPCRDKGGIHTRRGQTQVEAMTSINS